MKKKSMQKSIKNLMPLGIDFWEDFGGFWVPKSSQVGTKMGSNIDVKVERRLLIIRAPAAAGARCLQNVWWKLGTKIDQQFVKEAY